MVISSLLAAGSDIASAISSISGPAYGGEAAAAATRLGNLNAGYLWMMVNCMTSAGYVLAMRKRIKITNFKVGRFDR